MVKLGTARLLMIFMGMELQCMNRHDRTPVPHHYQLSMDPLEKTLMATSLAHKQYTVGKSPNNRCFDNPTSN